MEAQLVRKAVNRCAAQGKPFLFGVDFELREGFLWRIRSSAGRFRLPAERLPMCRIVSPGGGNYAPPGGFAYRSGGVSSPVRRHSPGLLRGDSFLTNLTERTPIRTNLTLDEIFRRSRARYKLLLPGRLVCFSPECFVRITDGVIRSYPMKGTIDAALPDAEARLLGITRSVASITPSSI